MDKEKSTDWVAQIKYSYSKTENATATLLHHYMRWVLYPSRGIYRFEDFRLGFFGCCDLFLSHLVPGG
jgi:hypothetical protein